MEENNNIIIISEKHIKKRQKNIKILITFITLIFLLAGGTFAWYSWNASDIGVDFVINSNIRIAVDGGVDITGKELYPTLDYTDTNYAITKTIKSWLLDPNDANNSTFNLKLNVMGISDNLKNSSFRWRIHKNGELKASGNFASVSTGASINLITNQIATTSKDIYTLYIYIDGSVDNDPSMAGGTYNFRLVAEGANAELVEVLPEPNSPDLVQGLIPVVYNETTQKWVKADSTNNKNSWYDYTNKKWANAVLVTDTNRETYKNASAGTEINDSDILAFYVWIPRYKYKVWNINKVAGTDSYNAKNTGIDIVFEDEIETTGDITCTYNFNVDPDNGGIDLSTTTAETCTGSNGQYYTHPAFTFGDTELRGFWIGKFELSSETPSATNGGGNSTTLTTRILPNVNSWRNNVVSNFFTVIQNMQTTNNIYGLSIDKTNTDSHMIKNMEWGAVAYLTYSKYGTSYRNNLLLNNCTSYITGIGGDGGISSTSCTTDANKYNGKVGVKASTTGNVYGVYDMHGGASEYVMSNASSESETYIFNSSNSGFADSWYDTFDNQSKINTYATGSTSKDQTAYNRGRLGDAISEIIIQDRNGWYNAKVAILNTTYSWIERGGYYVYDASTTTIFYSSVSSGKNLTSTSTRAILVGLSQ